MQLKASTRSGSSDCGDLLDGRHQGMVDVIDLATPLSAATSMKRCATALLALRPDRSIRLSAFVQGFKVIGFRAVPPHGFRRHQYWLKLHAACARGTSLRAETVPPRGGVPRHASSR